MRPCNCRICFSEPRDLDIEANRSLIEGVQANGWHMYHVAEGSVDWLYSIGFEHSFDQPEVAISGFGQEGMAAMMGDVADFYARGGEFAEARIIEQPDDAVLMFRSVHPEFFDSELFLAAAWFNRSLTRAAQGVVSSAENAPLPLQPRLWLPAAEQSINWRSFLSLDAGDWRHPIPWDTRVLVSKSITAGREWAYVVIHDEAGGWQCMDGYEFTPDDFELVPLFAILEIDPSVAEVLDLAPGEQAWRDGPDAAWQRERFKARQR
jgi:hypothetical protein